MKSESNNEYQVYSRRYSDNVDFKTQVKNHISKLKNDKAAQTIDSSKKNDKDSSN